MAGDERHETRCLRFEEIDWDAPITLAEQKQRGEIGAPVLKIDN